MFKSKLQEFCQSKAWLLPSYRVTREGPDHCPRFKAEVEVQGLSFTTPDFCRSSKDAQNTAAKLAFDYITGCENIGSTSISSPIARSTLPDTQQTSPIASGNEPNLVITDNCSFKGGTMHMYKNQLQFYAQKRNLELPAYSVERIGPPHSSRFKCKVTVDDKSYESEDYFCTIKEAESAAAKVALASIFPRGFEEDDPFIYKNLLQELLMKEMSCLPEYNTTLDGPAHMPKFVSVVEIQGETFRGQVAKTKKQAEMNVAKVAYITLCERKRKQNDRVDDSGADLKLSLQFPSSSGIDFQPTMEKQVEFNQVQCTKAISDSSMGILGGIQGLEDAQSAKEPESWADIASSSSSFSPVSGLSNEEKTKKKIMILPKSSIRSYPDAPVIYSDEKWIAFNTH